MMPKKIPFHKWNDILGFQTAQESVEILFYPVEVPDSEKELFLHHKPLSRYRQAYEDVLSNFITMGEFTYELYLATPYFVEIYEKWKQKQDFQWQFLFVSLIGACLATDFPYNHFSKKLNESLPKEIIENHLYSVKIMQEQTKAFISDHFEKLKQLNHTEAQYFCQCLFAILGDREASYIFFLRNFNGCSIVCPYCIDSDEICYEFDWNKINEESTCKLPFHYSDAAGHWYMRGDKSICKPPKEICLAPSAIGQWDWKSYDNDYVWFSNLLYFLGNEESAKKLSYYYGVFTCPNCGKTSIVMDLAKYTMIQNTESDL